MRAPATLAAALSTAVAAAVAPAMVLAHQHRRLPARPSQTPNRTGPQDQPAARLSVPGTLNAAVPAAVQACPYQDRRPVFASDGRTCAEVEVLGSSSLDTSRRFWEGFTPAGADRSARRAGAAHGVLHRRRLAPRRRGGDSGRDTARLVVTGDDDLEAATAQACPFLAPDVDARGWPEVGRRGSVIADAQARLRRLRRLRPCGFHSPYEAAAWSVLSKRVRIVQAARLRAELIARHGENGAFPHRPPGACWIWTFRAARLSTCARSPARRWAGGAAPRPGAQPGGARVQQVKGLGWFAAELVVVGGANAPGAVPRHERRLEAAISERYGPGHTLGEVSRAWLALPHLGGR
jgi:DNA-3-methyladenine glycosylase II